MSNDETQPASGSRWEQPADPSPAPPATQPVTPPAPVPAYAPAPQRHSRGRLLLAGGAVGVALVAGAGGFALGHATAGDGRDDPGRFGFTRNGGPMGGPMGGQGGQDGGPQGMFPGPGQPPGFPDGDGDSDGDKDGDNDGVPDGQQLPDDGSDQDAPNT
jgi:hypothetical protein